MLEINRLSSTYEVRRLNDSDVDDILTLCRGNVLYYRYCEARPTKEQIISDLHITPPGTDIANKYYIGFYDENHLVAVMDLIDGYPEEDMAFIGFFMVDHAVQGSGMIADTGKYLKSMGKTAVQLGIDKGNPQSASFWKKNGFVIIREVSRDTWTILVAEKRLSSYNESGSK